ncbi:glycoside hydrolase family 6 protein [Streptomyces sp. SID13726]|uniref:glycoside hydrolase family 6 protein n=1 Tax=Streptomyces sp. SID13726 TaxID=2706058 RepID=UPI0013B73FF1|nr:glycoside hydrolase family 6 protein [Streptomyces sp. SID13726]NEB04655.1 glycoside hydrolase family 6 protein [Streptomyces sp. SID13726]
MHSRRVRSLPCLLAALALLLVAAGLPAAPEPVSLWVDPSTPAALQAAEYRRLGRTEDAALMDRIAGRPQATWLTGANPGPTVRAATSGAALAGRTALLVAYHIPQRDCGSFSAGGADDAREYRAYVDSFAEGLGDRGALVVLEPDAVAQTLADCPQTGTADRLALLAYAVGRLKRQPHTRVYVDAGNPGWITDVSWLARALRRAGVDGADGFALNVSNFQTTATVTSYGRRLAEALGGDPHFVVDTSRNGNGPYIGVDAWCNPPGRALGSPPTTETGVPGVDAYLWIKRPGESDGTCRGGPPAGQWWPQYALDLARAAQD